jgi:hypothetical protein
MRDFSPACAGPSVPSVPNMQHHQIAGSSFRALVYQVHFVRRCMAELTALGMVKMTRDFWIIRSQAPSAENGVQFRD